MIGAEQHRRAVGHARALERAEHLADPLVEVGDRARNTRAGRGESARRSTTPRRRDTLRVAAGCAGRPARAAATAPLDRGSPSVGSAPSGAWGSPTDRGGWRTTRTAETADRAGGGRCRRACGRRGSRPPRRSRSASPRRTRPGRPRSPSCGTRAAAGPAGAPNRASSRCRPDRYPPSADARNRAADRARRSASCRPPPCGTRGRGARAPASGPSPPVRPRCRRRRSPTPAGRSASRARAGAHSGNGH